ncbi:hypothetical protein V6N13_069868 [Hibiscus sabdariffa]|uniref:Pentatricopeptide repeat-containing protein n=1 Tax=Hibiscus sabdariffa TaxID=183260 RepID=A0ABR2BIU2_9ROSI
MRLSRRADAGEELVSWNTMIAAYVQSNRFHEAFGLFNKYVAACMLRACTGLGALEQGEWTHGYMQNKGIELDLKLAMSIIDSTANPVHDSSSRMEPDNSGRYVLLANTHRIAG